MDVHYNVLNFEDENGCRPITSPRSVDACLKAGLVPNDLLPKPRKAFVRPNLTDEMIDIAFNLEEKKRKEYVMMVTDLRRGMLSQDELDRPDSPGAAHAARLAAEAAARSNAMMEKEMKRAEALKRRQESEIAKMIEKETQAIELQKKIAKGEEEQVKRAKEHEKKVAAAKLDAQKKVIQRLQQRADAAAEELRNKKEMMKKEKEFEAKMAVVAAKEAERIAAEVKARELERAAKVEAKKKRSEEAISAQFKLAEDTRLKMEEREKRVKAVMEEKKQIKKAEVAAARAAATIRIADAMDKFHSFHEAKKKAFYDRQAAAVIRAKEKAVEDREILQKQAEFRERKINLREKRLEDAYRTRYGKRMEIVSRRKEKDKTYGVISKERDKINALKKFQTDLKLREKRDNVNRIARATEYKRIQLVQKIEKEDMRFLKIRAEKAQLLQEHRDDVKRALTRKHQISDAMEQMRMTNDFSKLDQLFSTDTGDDNKGDEEEEEPAQKK